MTRFAIIMEGYHGGELDRRLVDGDKLKEAFKEMIDDVELDDGDVFKVVQIQA